MRLHPKELAAKQRRKYAGCSARHCLVRSTQHVLHHGFQPLFKRKFGLNCENARNWLQRVQCRPVGGYRVTQQNATPRSFTTLRIFFAAS
jgi:hypothetical protein